MADNHSKEVRSYNMSRIRSKNTKPEEIVRKYLFSHGFRYRKNDKRLPGQPDVVLPKYMTVIFVHGCFWHCHGECPKFILPKSNREYWVPKLMRNQERDKDVQSKLCESGWKVIIIWECELENKALREERLNRLISQIATSSSEF